MTKCLNTHMTHETTPHVDTLKSILDLIETGGDEKLIARAFAGRLALEADRLSPNKIPLTTARVKAKTQPLRVKTLQYMAERGSWRYTGEEELHPDGFFKAKAWTGHVGGVGDESFQVGGLNGITFRDNFWYEGRQQSLLIREVSLTCQELAGVMVLERDHTGEPVSQYIGSSDISGRAEPFFSPQV
jgi:hypothetical protein